MVSMTINSVKFREKSLRTDIIALKKPTALDKIIETVPKPKGAVPNFGLPKWKLMPLESKIPMIPGPQGAYNFSRKKLGKKLWVQTSNAEFNLNDPCNYEMELTYDPLHDEHLTKFFSRTSNIQRMLELGLITENLDVKCSLKDYNMYRKFLKKLHNDNINRELKRQSDLADEKRILQLTEFAAQREIERKKIAERKMLAKNKAKEKQREQEEKKIQEMRQKAEEFEKRKKSIELAKKEATQKHILESKAQENYMRQKRALALERQNHEILETLMSLKTKEKKRRKAKKERLAREAEEKRRIIEEKWQRRKEQEELEIAAKQSALFYAAQQRIDFIENYNRKVERERTRLQKRLKKIRRFVRCYIARAALGRSCCRKIKKQKKVKNGNEESVATRNSHINSFSMKKSNKKVRLSFLFSCSSVLSIKKTYGVFHVPNIVHGFLCYSSMMYNNI